jgi:hypothetical protein
MYLASLYESNNRLFPRNRVVETITVDQRVHKNPPLDRVLSQLNSIHAFTHVFQISFSILHLWPGLTHLV